MDESSTKMPWTENLHSVAYILCTREIGNLGGHWIGAGKKHTIKCTSFIHHLPMFTNVHQCSQLAMNPQFHALYPIMVISCPSSMVHQYEGKSMNHDLDCDDWCGFGQWDREILTMIHTHNTLHNRTPHIATDVLQLDARIATIAQACCHGQNIGPNSQLFVKYTVMSAREHTAFVVANTMYIFRWYSKTTKPVERSGHQTLVLTSYHSMGYNFEPIYWRDIE